VCIKKATFSTTKNLTDLIFDNSIVKPIGIKSMYILPLDELNNIKQMYQLIFSGSEFSVHHVSTLCYQFSRLKLGNYLLSSTAARSDRLSYICAKWLGDDLNLLNNMTDCSYRPGCIQNFFQQDIVIKKDGKEMLIQPTVALVKWYKIHPEKNYLLSPITLWSTDFEPLCTASFMPVNRIATRCAQAQLHFEFNERPDHITVDKQLL